jgi:hypothetical protein
MRLPAVAVAAVALLGGCGLTNTADPNLVHVADISYSDTSCSASACNGVLRFRLLDSENKGRFGLVQVGSDGVQPYMSMWTNADGWRQLGWTIEQGTRPYTITVCPQGLSAGNSRCASVSTG